MQTRAVYFMLPPSLILTLPILSRDQVALFFHCRPLPCFSAGANQATPRVRQFESPDPIQMNPDRGPVSEHLELVATQAIPRLCFGRVQFFHELVTDAHIRYHSYLIQAYRQRLRILFSTHGNLQSVLAMYPPML